MKKIAIIISFLLLISGCSLIDKITGQKKETKEEAYMQYHGKEERSYDDAKDKHIDLQSEKTLEMMKKTKKRSRQINKSKKESWIKRFLGL